MSDNIKLLYLDRKKEIMNYAKQTFISSTFWTERLGPAAALKTLEIMEKLKSWEIITKTGKYLNKQWLKIANENNLKININGLPSISKFEIKSQNFQSYKTYITQEMLREGILASNVIYICTEHSQYDIDNYFQILDAIMKTISACENDDILIDSLLNSPVCHGGFKRLN